MSKNAAKVALKVPNVKLSFRIQQIAQILLIHLIVWMQAQIQLLLIHPTNK